MSAKTLDLSEWSRRDKAAERAGRALLDKVLSKRSELEAIFAEIGVAEAYLFGSLAQGKARAGSDVDIAVSGCPAAAFYRLGALIERALGAPLDLIDLDVAPPDFAAAIRRDGRQLFPRDREQVRP